MTATSMLSTLLNRGILHQKGPSDIRVEERAERFLFCQAAICSRVVLWEREHHPIKTKTTQHTHSVILTSSRADLQVYSTVPVLFKEFVV